MNIPLNRRLGFSKPAYSGIRLDEATVVPIGALLSVIFFDRRASRRERMQAEQNGLPIPRPFIAAELPLRSGGARHVLFVPQGLETILANKLLIRLNDIPVAEIDPRWLQLPQEDLPALVSQLTKEGLRKLLRVMLTTVASLFAGKAQADLIDAIARLMDICGIQACAPVAKCEIGNRILVSYPVPGLSPTREPLKAVAILGDRLIGVRKFDYCSDGSLLHVLLPSEMSKGQIVSFFDSPVRLASSVDLVTLQSVQVWTRDRNKVSRDWLSACVGRVSTATHGRERPIAPSEPEIAVWHLSSTKVGLLYALSLKDPSRVVRKVILEQKDKRVELTPVTAGDGTSVLTGLAPMGYRTGKTDTLLIRILYQSGRLQTLADKQIVAFDGQSPPGFMDAWAIGANALQPLARARASFQREAPQHVTECFGAVSRCRLRIVTAIGHSGDMIRARAAIILAEHHGAAVEVVCTATQGTIVGHARQALASTTEIYGIPHRLMIFPDGLTGGETLLAALKEAQDVPALVLGANVVPGTPGWLAFWLRRLCRREVIAPVMMASDGSVAATQEGEDPYRGLPSGHLPVSGRCSARPLADCLALSPVGIARLIASGAPHPDPAVWLASALAGTARSETRYPFHRIGSDPTRSEFAGALAEAEFAMLDKDRE